MLPIFVLLILFDTKHYSAPVLLLAGSPEGDVRTAWNAVVEFAVTIQNMAKLYLPTSYHAGSN